MKKQKQGLMRTARSITNDRLPFPVGGVEAM